MADHDRVGGNVPEPLSFGVEPANQAAEEIKGGKRIDKSQQIAQDNLTELQTQAIRVNDSEGEEFLSECLTSPGPLASYRIADANGEVTEDIEGSGKVGADHLENDQEFSKKNGESGNAEEVEEPRQGADHRPGQ